MKKTLLLAALLAGITFIAPMASHATEAEEESDYPPCETVIEQPEDGQGGGVAMTSPIYSFEKCKFTVTPATSPRGNCGCQIVKTAGDKKCTIDDSLSTDVTESDCTSKNNTPAPAPQP